MRGLDTNVLVRLLVDDDPDQAGRAEAFLRAEHAAGSPCYVNRIVLCELVWVLERTYRYPRAEVAGALERLWARRRSSSKTGRTCAPPCGPIGTA